MQLKLPTILAVLLLIANALAFVTSISLSIIIAVSIFLVRQVLEIKGVVTF
jgi:hypothetical protein